MKRKEKLENSISLRPRFYVTLKEKKEILLDKMKSWALANKGDYDFRISGNHIWAYIKPPRNRYYSPHLHLELEDSEEGTRLRGLFGPNQSLWTFFIFLHFVVACCFIIFSVMAYSNWQMQKGNTLNFMMMTLMILIWFTLYFIARYNRRKGTPQMHELHHLLSKFLEEVKS